MLLLVSEIAQLVEARLEVEPPAVEAGGKAAWQDVPFRKQDLFARFG